MRKETIIKFEKEFMAWCKGESVLKGAPISMSDTTLHWEEVRDFNDWKALDTIYVLNDSYSAYRKALAEGKTVQYYVDGFAGWQDVDSVGNHCISGKNNYRIKPEDTQFKVGDWVKHKDNSKFIKVTQNNKVTPTHFELWKPQPGEWCWNIVFGLIKVIYKTETDGHYVCWNPWKKVEQTCTIEQPFFGELPTHLKESK